MNGKFVRPTHPPLNVACQEPLLILSPDPLATIGYNVNGIVY